MAVPLQVPPGVSASNLTADELLELELQQDGPFTHATGVRKIRPLRPNEVRASVQSELNDALGGYDSQIEEQRRKALSYYHGRPFGNEQEGRSSVILTDVADTIEWVMPQLMRMFTGGDVVRYTPAPMGTPSIQQLGEAEMRTDQATDYINQKFRHKLNGFRVFHDWFKSALLEKNCVAKVWTETRYEPQQHTYEGIDEMQIAMLLQDQDVQIVGHEERGDGTFDVAVVKVAPKKELKIEAIPPEQFLIARRVIRLDDNIQFCAHRVKVTVSDLIAMGYPPELVENIPSDDSPEYTIGRVERYQEDETHPETYRRARADEASREIWLTECYMHIDEDGDGYAELRKITVAGEQSIVVLDDEPINRIPFADLTPVPMPHKYFGLSLADLVMDLQLIRSTLLRSMLDNLYLTNNARTAVVEDDVNIEDLLVSRPGGIVRTENIDSIKPLETAPFPPMAYNMLEYLEEVRQNRTGITRYTQGMDATSLNQTASGLGRIMEAAQSRIELIARIFAETGVKRAFELLYHELSEGGFQAEMVKMRGQWIPMDPGTWEERVDTRVELGLGVGQAAERVRNLGIIGELQKGAMASGLGPMVLTPRHLYNTAAQITRAAGIANEEAFFKDPGFEAQFPPPKPTPKDIEAQTNAETKRATVAVRDKEANIEAMQQGSLIEHRKNELAMKEKIAMAKIKSEEKIALAQIHAKNLETPVQEAA